LVSLHDRPSGAAPPSGSPARSAAGGPGRIAAGGAIAPDAERFAARLAEGRRPYVTLKAAATLDGRLATRSGQSQWITGEAARAHAMRLRAGHDAILVGMGTVRADDPRLTVRGGGLRAQPARVVLDSRARIALDARLLAADGARRIVVTGSAAPRSRLTALDALGAEVLRCGTPRPQPSEYLALLRAAGLRALLVEGGAQVHANLIAQGAADELFLYLAGCVIGDRDAPAWCGALGVERLEQAPRVRLDAPQAIGPDVLLHGWFEPPAAGAR
jgi:diaminohydroxyphosphoribosylaminopyrimidine deaminase / 5-amino-6-(5-phosphoribosylamino)uracil reductase